jgi:DNA-binding response OmpR family regulator
VGIKILLADDSVTAQNMGKKILSEAGHQVVTVSNGAAAAKKIAEIKPNLVLLDVFMPGYSGLEICEKLRASAETAKLPVLLTVGRMEPYNPADGARVKADGIIVKPFEASDLIAAVERLVENIAPLSESESKPAAKQAPPEGAQSESISVAKEPPPYEQTMRLDAAQIAAMLNSAKQQISTVEPPPPARVEFEVSAPQTTQELQGTGSKADAGLPGFTDDLEAAAAPRSEFPESHPSTMASYMEQYLSEAAPAPLEPVAPAFQPMETAAASAPAQGGTAASPGFEHFAATPALSSDLLPHSFAADSTADVPLASAEGLELTSAPPVGEVSVDREPGLEATLQSADTPITILKDPALVSDPHYAAIDFSTQFGITEQPVSPEFAAHAEPSAPVDDFEARLNAVMASSYEELSTELPFASQPVSPEMPGEAAPGLAADLQSEAQAWETPSPVIEASANLAEPTFAVQSSVEQPALPALDSVAATPEADVAERTLLTAAPEAVPAEGPAEEVQSVAAVSAATVEPSGPVAVELAVSPETDDAVIGQMRESFPQLPDHSLHAVESSESAPLTMAAAAAAAPPSAHLGRETELEIVRTVSAVASEVAGSGAATGDANNIASAVEKVMQRELPSLIWKIMTELDLQKR